MNKVFMVVGFVAFCAGATAETRNLYWGDTHVHTTFSVDAYMLGNRSVGPDEAYRFGKGEAIPHPVTGESIQLEVPLDFMIVADHARGMGSLPAVDANEPPIAGTLLGNFFKAAMESGKELEAFQRLAEIVAAGDPDGSQTGERILDGKSLGAMMQLGRSSWAQTIEAADRHNAPGTFTAFIGWEWSADPDGANLHRVVFTKDDQSVAKQFMPFGSHMSDRPEALWAWLASTSERTGARFLAIPHNANISKGRMFDLVDSDGNPITAAYVETRARWERVVEITQMKGDSETRPILSPTDEFAGFEFYKFARSPKPGDLDAPGSFVRPALKRGLAMGADLGVNPYQLGIIGSTDTHTGLSTTREDNFAGKFGFNTEVENKTKVAAPEGSRTIDFGAAGLAAVWAESNSREAIFDAFERREVYGTTGTRIRLRFFGGWGFEGADVGNVAEVGYRDGVPMGSVLKPAMKSTAPSFLVHALKDPNGANLDRIQIIKGWVGDDGQTHERLFDVALSDGRGVVDGVVAPVGTTVDLDTATYTNSIGAVELAAVWRDPEFEPTQDAFYYARVIEIPTPRHTLYDAVALSAEPVGDHPATLQERAYSSPIWYESKRK